MGFAQSPITSELHSAIRKQKQFMEYIFSVPVLFCIIILFMLLYLFYQYKKASALISHPPSLASPTIITRASSFAISVFEAHLEDFKDMLPTIVFDEELKAKNTVCCICLGEFEIKEELIQVPSCKHIFHSDCICNWLISSDTCPLCRCSIDDIDNTEVLVLPPPQRSPAVLLPAAGTSVQLVGS